MYIPRGVSEVDGLAPTAGGAPTWRRGQPEMVLPGVVDSGGGGDRRRLLERRQFSDDPLQNTNISIGVIIAIVLAAFLAALFAFLWVYRHTIRCSPARKKRRRRPSSASRKSSKASSHHGSDAEAAPEPEPAAEGAEPAA
ncbi:hypothetical protein A9K55_006985 [Cordyceps militaris]|uniref:Uncharacterized protein n=1 Tax=Cordyceps militaris TaxID=73501 RepID=A0A2H4SFF9_CORMI|nr:hypothetical protein A9K55_006985 [Cordyceps militaris]